MTYEVYERHQYDVSALDCYNQLLDIIEENDSLVGLKIPIEEYASNLQLAIEDYIERKRIDENWIQAKKENAFLVSPTEPSFNWWFAIYLSLVEYDEIPLILDYYHTNWKNKNVDFVNFLKYDVRNIQKRNLFHKFNKCKKEIIGWIRETEKLNPKQSQSKAGFSESTLFNSPYHGYLLNELLAFCEDESKDRLRKVLKGENIDSPVIFNSYFKKISLRRALKRLIISGDVKMNQEECANWQYSYFRIRNKSGLSTFSVDSSKAVFGKSVIQTAKSQLKFDDWYKND